MVMEVQAATIGDQAPTPAAGSLEVFTNQNGLAYLKTSAGAVTPMVSGVSSFGDSALTGAVSSTAATAQLNAATAALKGLLSAANLLTINAEQGRNSSLAVPRVFRPGEYMVGNTYDPTGVSNSTTSFTAMMTAFNAFNDRGVIELPPGVFKVDPSVIAGFGSAPGRIRGSGRGVTVLIPNSGASDFITLNSAVDGFELCDFAIYNTSGTPFTTGYGINTNGADDVAIHDMLFVDLFKDIGVKNSSIKVSMQRLVHSQGNGSATSIGIEVDNGLAGDTYIGPDIVMSNTGATRRKACVNIHESGHYEVNQCNLTGSQQGILIDPAAGKIVGFGFHNEVLCDSSTVNGMSVTAPTATSTVKNIKSANSWYSGTLTGGSGAITSGTAGGIINGISFAGDRFLNNGGHGFQHAFGTDLRWSDCDFKGNSLPANGGTTNTSDGLNVSAAVSNWSVNGGKYGGSDTVPTATTQRYGVNVAAGAGDFIKIEADDLSGNATGPLQFLATGVNCFISGCPGLAAPYARGAASASIAATQVTLANTLIPKNSQRISTTYRVTARAQNITTLGAVTWQVRCGAANDAVGASAANGVVVAALSAGGAANDWVTVEFYVTVTAVGAGGNINASGYGAKGAVAFSTATAARASGAGFLAVDFTADRYLTLSAAIAAGALVVYSSGIEVVNY